MNRLNNWLVVPALIVLNLFYFKSYSADKYITQLDTEIKKLEKAKANTESTYLLPDTKKYQLREYDNKIKLIRSKIDFYNAFSKMDTIQRNKFVNDNNNRTSWEFVVGGEKQKVTDSEFTNALRSLNKRINDAEMIQFSDKFKQLPLNAQEKILSKYKNSESNTIKDPMHFLYKQDNNFKLALNTIKNKNSENDEKRIAKAASPAVSAASARPKTDKMKLEKKSPGKNNPSDSQKQKPADSPPAAAPASVPASAAAAPAPAVEPASSQPSASAPNESEKNEETNAEKCLAVDTRVKNKNGTLPPETPEQQKIAENKCIVGTFNYGECKNDSGSVCLKRCNGILIKDYEEDISGSEILDLIFDPNNQNNSTPTNRKKVLVKTIRDDSINNDTDNEVIKKKVMDITGAKHGKWKLDGTDELTKSADVRKSIMQELAIELNKVAGKCDEIKTKSFKLIHAKNRNYEEEINSHDQLNGFISENLNEKNKCDSNLDENDNVLALKIDTDCGERILIPYALKDFGDKNPNTIIEAKKLNESSSSQSPNVSDDESVALIYDKDKKSFYVRDNKVCHFGEFTSSREHYAKLSRVHASHLGPKYCEVFNAAKKAAASSGAQPVPAEAAAPAEPAAQSGSAN